MNLILSNPNPDLNVKSAIKRNHVRSMSEIYDYPGEYTSLDEGETCARTRIEEIQKEQGVAQGSSNARGIHAGSLFELTDFPRDDQNLEYLIVSAIHQLESNPYRTGNTAQTENVYSCSFKALNSQQPFRSSRMTPKPVVQGPQTAIVVGPSGEEIHTDEYGRVKVRFHWDRESKSDENSSCWIRVAQINSGNKWGAFHIPRIGHEVIVEFLEGDPDHPLIIGSLYHASNKPPYDLPAEKTKSTIKTNSSPGGGGFNEIRFEDKKGEEQLFIHAENNQDIRIKNDCFEWIGNNRHLIIKSDQKEQVENNRHEKIGSDHMEEIGKDRHLKVKGKEAKAVDGSCSLTVKGDVIEVFKANHSEQVTNDYYLKGDNIVIEAMTNVTVKVGQSYIAIEAGGIKIGTNGQIVIEAMNTLSLKGTAGATIESPVQATIKSANTTVKGDAMTTIQGGLVKIN